MKKTLYTVILFVIFIKIPIFSQSYIFTINEFNAGITKEDTNYIYSMVNGRQYVVDKSTRTEYQFHNGSAWQKFYNVGTERVESGRSRNYYIINGDMAFNRNTYYSYNDAINFYTMAITQSPNDIELYVKRARAYQHLSFLYLTHLQSLGITTMAWDIPAISYFNNKTLDDYAQALRIDPNNIVILFERGEFRFRVIAGDEHRRGVDDFNAIIRIDPNHEEAYYYLAKYASSGAQFWKGASNIQENINTALSYFNKLIQLNTGNAKYLADVGYMYYNVKQYDNAISWYNRAISIDSNNAQHYYRRADIYFHFKKDYTRAKSDYEQALRINSQPSLDSERHLPDSWEGYVHQNLDIIRQRGY